MACLEFTAEYHVGNRVQDMEHKVLFFLINRLQDFIASDDTDGYAVNEVIAGLNEYAKTHFFVEEELMKAYGYENYPAHKRAHDHFVQQVDELEQVLKENPAHISNDALEFLEQWLIDHILKTDKQLAAFLQQQGLT